MINVKTFLSILSLAFCHSFMFAQSKTLPVMHINTDNNAAIKSKTEYVQGSFYIEDFSGKGWDTGSEESPVRLEIRGRGNSSWKGRKKPYKIRLVEKRKMLGMKKNKHWVLINFGDATIAGMKLGTLLGMPWNPSVEPVEVVLNDDYIGLYLLGENIRIHKNRVNIYKQPDNNDDDETIPYGWLIEVDNYYGENQVMFRENSNWNINITYHSPDTLSQKQRIWLTDELMTINEKIYESDKENSTWEEYIDPDAMARYFIAQEVLDNTDGFHGSFWLYKDKGEDARWMAGPLWDLNCGKRKKTDYTFRMKTSYAFTPHWIGELIKDEDFCSAVREQWSKFYPAWENDWLEYIDERVRPCAEAYECDYERWPGKEFIPLEEKLEDLKYWLGENMKWFDQHLPHGTITGITERTAESGNFAVYNLQGQKVADSQSHDDAARQLPEGINIIKTKNGEIRKVMMK